MVAISLGERKGVVMIILLNEMIKLYLVLIGSTFFTLLPCIIMFLLRLIIVNISLILNW